MATDVHATLVNIVAGEGGKSTDEAEAYVIGCANRAAHRDVY